MYQLLIAGVLPHVQFENNFLLNMHIHSVVVKVCAVIGAAQLVGVRLLTRNQRYEEIRDMSCIFVLSVPICGHLSN